MDLNDIIKKLEEKGVPSGFVRGFVVIETEFYIVIPKKQGTFLGRKLPTIELSKVEIELNGVFFAKNYRARLLIEKNRCLAIELLRRLGHKKRRHSGKDDDDNDVDDSDNFPYPYIFVSPESPDDLSMSGQLHVHSTLQEEIPDDVVSCQYCGKNFAKEEYSHHSCRTKP